MNTKPLVAAAAFMLGGYIYTETLYGRTVVVGLPVRSETTTNKNVTVNAPPGTTVTYQDSMSVGYPCPYPYCCYGYRFQTTFAMRTQIRFQSLFQS